MSNKRKFSESFQNDTDVVQSLLKYRASSAPSRQAMTTPCATVSQDHLRNTIDQFISIYEGLDHADETRKPNFSYTELIFLSIMRSPNFCLPISEIYRYIQTQYAFFHNSSKEHWKNAIRHSLSKTKCFTKIGLENQKPRNGVLNRSAFLWTIMPKSLLNFARGDYRPTSKGMAPNALRKNFDEVSTTGLWEGCVYTLTSRIEAFRNILNTSSSPAKIFQLQVCHFTDTNQFTVTSFSPTSVSTAPISLPTSRPGNADGNHLPVLSPRNLSAIPSLPTPPASDPASPNSESGSDSFYSSSPSDSSGYDTIGDISSPEHGNNDLDRRGVTSPHSLDVEFSGLFQSNQNTHVIPEVAPSCIENIPFVPEFPSVNETLAAYSPSVSLPCFVEMSVVDQDFNLPCLYESCLSTDFTPDITISQEERSILLEFLTF